MVLSFSLYFSDSIVIICIFFSCMIFSSLMVSIFESFSSILFLLSLVIHGVRVFHSCKKSPKIREYSCVFSKSFLRSWWVNPPLWRVARASRLSIFVSFFEKGIECYSDIILRWERNIWCSYFFEEIDFWFLKCSIFSRVWLEIEYLTRK